MKGAQVTLALKEEITAGAVEVEWLVYLAQSMLKGACRTLP